MVSCIYQIKNMVNGKSYIGTSENFVLTCNTNRSLLKTGKHNSHTLQFDYDQYGLESFSFDVIEEVNGDRESLNAAKRKWIVQNDTIDNGYNSVYCGKRIKKPYDQKPLIGKTFIINNGLINRRHSNHLPIPEGWLRGKRKR